MTETQIILQQLIGFKMKTIAKLLGVRPEVVSRWNEGHSNASGGNMEMLIRLREGKELPDEVNLTLDEIKTLVKSNGGAKRVAKELNVSMNLVYLWTYGKSKITKLQIEKLEGL